MRTKQRKQSRAKENMEAECVEGMQSCHYSIVSGRGTLAVLDTDPPLVIYMGHRDAPTPDVSDQRGFSWSNVSLEGGLARTRNEHRYGYCDSFYASLGWLYFYYVREIFWDW